MGRGTAPNLHDCRGGQRLIRAVETYTRTARVTGPGARPPAQPPSTHRDIPKHTPVHVVPRSKGPFVKKLVVGRVKILIVQS